uniref:Serine/arginine repetitive matrix protein 1-like n=1 Tax=Dermatophagoides pteronyssinus TaxID=6956 RepID=A0A6P6YLY5_DERPT|nr:serine/arginine repetitive matrix protein 1-like [Dermatophagoides pteronyssinus]
MDKVVKKAKQRSKISSSSSSRRKRNQSKTIETESDEDTQSWSFSQSYSDQPKTFDSPSFSLTEKPMGKIDPLIKKPKRTPPKTVSMKRSIRAQSKPVSRKTSMRTPPKPVSRKRAMRTPSKTVSLRIPIRSTKSESVTPIRSPSKTASVRRQKGSPSKTVSIRRQIKQTSSKTRKMDKNPTTTKLKTILSKIKIRPHLSKNKLKYESNKTQLSSPSKTRKKPGSKKNKTLQSTPSKTTKQARIIKQSKDNKIKGSKMKKTIDKINKRKISETKIPPKSIYDKAISKQVKRLTTRSELNAIAELCLKLMRFTPKTMSTDKSKEKSTRIYKSPIGLIKRYEIIEASTTAKPEHMKDTIKRDITVMKIQITETREKPKDEDIKKTELPPSAITPPPPPTITPLSSKTSPPPTITPLSLKTSPPPTITPSSKKSPPPPPPPTPTITPPSLPSPPEQTIAKLPEIIVPAKDEEKQQLKIIDPFGERNSLSYRRLEDYENKNELDASGGLSMRFNPYLEGRCFYEKLYQQNLDAVVEVIPGLIDEELTYTPSISTVDPIAQSSLPSSVQPILSYTQPGFKWIGEQIMVDTTKTQSVIDEPIMVETAKPLHVIYAPTMAETTKTSNVIISPAMGETMKTPNIIDVTEKKEGTQMSAFGERDSLFYHNPYSYPIYDQDDTEILFNPYLKGVSFNSYYDPGELDKLIEIVHGSNYNDEINVDQTVDNSVQQSLLKLKREISTPKVFEPMIVPRKQKQPEKQQQQQYQSLSKIIRKESGQNLTQPIKKSSLISSKSPLPSTIETITTETHTNEVITLEIIVEALPESKSKQKP